MKKLYLLMLLGILTINALSAQCVADRHTTNAHDGWMSCETAMNPAHGGESHWIRYDFGQTHRLYDLTLWNVNHPDFLKNGIRTAIIDVSSNGTTWTTVDTITVPQANGSGFYTGHNGPDLGGVQARYLLITAVDNHGGGCTGLSEFRVFTEDQSSTVFELEITACENDGIYRGLNGGMDLGGTYSGLGVSDNGDDSFDFNAESVGPGEYEIAYTHSGGSEMAMITVLPCGVGPCATCPTCNEFSQAQLDSDMIPSDKYYGVELESMGTVVDNSEVHFRASEAVDLASGFEVMSSGTFTAAIGSCEVSKMTNGSFENGQEGWLFNEWEGAAASLSFDNTTAFDGQQSARIAVTNATGAGWNIQFRQVGHSIEAGKTYQVTFAAKAAGGGNFNYNVHLDEEPWTSYSSASPTISEYWREFEVEFTAEGTVDGILRITFQFGNSRETTYWIDKVRFVELN